MITKRQTSENADFQMFLSFCLLLLRLPALVGDAGDAAVMLHDSHWQSSCHTCETGVGLLSFSSRSSNGKEKSTCIDTQQSGILASVTRAVTGHRQ